MATSTKSDTEPRKKVAVKGAAPAKKAAGKPAAVKAPVKTTRSKAATTAQAAPAEKATKPVIGSAKRRNYIEVAAYYIAERRRFVGGSPADDWKAAEAEIDRLIGEGKLRG
jgi:hypothetical protein